MRIIALQFTTREGISETRRCGTIDIITSLALCEGNFSIRSGAWVGACLFSSDMCSPRRSCFRGFCGFEFQKWLLLSFSPYCLWVLNRSDWMGWGFVCLIDPVISSPTVFYAGLQDVRFVGMWIYLGGPPIKLACRLRASLIDEVTLETVSFHGAWETRRKLVWVP